MEDTICKCLSKLIQIILFIVSNNMTFVGCQKKTKVIKLHHSLPVVPKFSERMAPRNLTELLFNNACTII